MNSFPLVRVKWSNEHFMAAVFCVLVLYHLPLWAQNPSSIPGFILLVLTGLAVDVVINIIRYKKPVCAVSAAVTSAMLSLLTPGVPLWGQLLGVAVALVLGKHIWGGTGKNIINPAITGLLFIIIFFKVDFPPFVPSALLIPALVLSLPFIVFRPFAGAGFMAGMIVSLIFSHGLTIANVLSYGVIFWGCLVITDPVTITRRPILGFIAGLLAGFASLFFYPSAIIMAIGVLVFNLFSFIADDALYGVRSKLRSTFRIKSIVPFSKDETIFRDLTGDTHRDLNDVPVSDKETILQRIRKNEVYGFGGAAFPTYQKILTVLNSRSPKKYLIINGVECDPGLIHDKWLLRRYNDEIFKGITALCSCSDFSSVIVAVKDADGIVFPGQVKIHKVRDYFPAGAEKILIKEVLGIDVESGAIPAEAGILVLNVQTVYSIYEAVYKDKKADTKFLTAANIVENKGQVLKVRLGMKVYDAINEAYPNHACVFTGGGLMQAHAAEEEDVIDKNVNFIAAGKFPKYKESPLCSNCGACIAHCPAGIAVNKIAMLVDEGKIEQGAKYHAEKCILCGGCSYSCPAGRNLAVRIKKAKEFIIS